MTLGKAGLTALVVAMLAAAASCDGRTTGHAREDAVRGVLDLRTWDFCRDGPAGLTGSWSFIWGELAGPERFLERRSHRGFIHVPGIWNGRIERGREIGEYGCATYRLQVLLPVVRNRGERLAVMVPDLGTAYQLFLDGVPAGGGGVVGESSRTGRPGYRPDLYGFSAEGDCLDVLLHVSNFHHRKGGAWEKIIIGPEAVMRQIRERRLVRDFFLFGSIVIIGLYHLLLFIMRRKERSYLFFGLFCMLIAVRIITTGDYYITKLVPGMRWEAVVGAEYLSFFAAVPLFFLFMGSLFPAEFSRRILRTAVFAGAVFCSAVILFPPRIYTHTMQTCQAYAIMMALYGFGVLVLAIKRKRAGAIPFMAGFAVLFITVVNDFLQSNHLVQTGYLVPFGLFIFILLKAFLLSHRFSRAYDAIEKLSDELERKQRRMEEIHALKDEFLAAVSHEIRTPLNSMIGLAESMIEGRQGLLSLEARYNLGLISAGGKRLARLVNDLVDSTRLRNHDIALCKSAVDLRIVADIVCAISRPLIGRKKVWLFNDIPSDIPPVHADEGLVQQVLQILVAIALDRTDAGPVVVSARAMAGSSAAAVLLEISVADTGGDICPDLVLLAGTDEHDSAGDPDIRFSIASRIVELHGGTISVHSVPSGARMAFTLPLSGSDMDDAAPASRFPPVFPATGVAEGYAGGTETAVPRPISGNSGHVLVVDDDMMDRQVMSHYLAAGDYSIEIARDGSEALDALGKEQYDLVLLDVVMPGMSGYDLCREIRKRYSLHELPVLVLTARYGIRGLVAGFESGANDYLLKPIHREELLARVRTLVALKRAVRDHEEARYKLLQERMNPHFLFNALNTVHALIRKDPNLADRAVIMLADNYRFLIDHSFLTLVPFEEEWRFVMNYLELQELRFRDSLSISMDREGDFSGISIPPLTIQPLVENALKHGVQKKGGQGTVRVRARMEGGRLDVEVIDNGAGLDSGDIFLRSLGNIRKRLHHCFGEADISLDGNPEGGVTATVIVPRVPVAAART